MGLAWNKIYFGNTRPWTKAPVYAGFAIPNGWAAEVGGGAHFLLCPTKFINCEDLVLLGGEMYGPPRVTRDAFRRIPFQIDLVGTNVGTTPHELKHEWADCYVVQRRKLPRQGDSSKGELPTVW